MRFASPGSQPTLTPLGHRLLSLSEEKLYHVEVPHVGSRESGSALWKSVLLRQTVDAAFQSIDRGYVGDLNDWHAPNALGLQVLSEEEEGEEDLPAYNSFEVERREDEWFDQLLESLSDERGEWVESTVESAQNPSSLPLREDQRPVSSEVFRNPIPTLVLPELEVEVHVETVEVTEACEDMEEFPLASSHSSIIFEEADLPPTPALSPQSDASSPEYHSLPHLDLNLNDDYDLEECEDGFDLPPPLYRSWSSASSEDECECVTPPPGSCEMLEEEVDYVSINNRWRDAKRLKLDDSEEDVLRGFQTLWGLPVVA